MLKIYMAGGGSGGHLFPGISLAQAIKLREPEAEITFLISGKKLDTTLLENRGFPCEKIEQRHIPSHPKQIKSFMITNAKALWRVTRLMFRDRPDVVVGLGGYASFAAAMAAKISGIPLVLLEQNVIPGKANRALALAADRVFCQWKRAARYFVRRDNLRFKGNPIRDSLKMLSRQIARAMLGLESGKRTLLVLGGSQGAGALNKAMLEAVPMIQKSASSIQIIHLSGHTDMEIMDKAYKEAGITASVHGFLEEMQIAYSAADLVFCRAGGTTIAELTAVGLPSVLVPLPNSAQNHQFANAKELADNGAAILIEQKDLTGEKFQNVVLNLLLDEERLTFMSQWSKLCGRPNAAAEIAGSIVEEFKLERNKQLAQLLKV